MADRLLVGRDPASPTPADAAQRPCHSRGRIVRGTMGNSGDWQQAHPACQRHFAADQFRNRPQKTKIPKLRAPSPENPP